MTSLAVFPPLKRTITDIMEDELYHLPNNSGSNISSSNFNLNITSTNPNNFNNNGQQSQPASRYNSLGSIQPSQQPFSQQFQPIIQSQQQHQGTNVTNSAQINSVFNNDSYLTNIAPYSFEMNEQQQYNQQNQVPEVSPFADYANPESQFGNVFTSNINSTNNTASSRRRFTTLESHSNEKPIKDEDYYLFNTDIQPSHLVAKNDDSCLPNDDYLCLNTPLYVPPKQAQEFPIPGYENDYLMMSGVEDFDEDIEDPISSDEEDDDNYFHDDFDEMIMNNLPQPVNNDFINQPQQSALNSQHTSSSITDSIASLSVTGSTDNDIQFNDQDSFDHLIFSSQVSSNENIPTMIHDQGSVDDENSSLNFNNTQETTPDEELEDFQSKSHLGGEQRQIHNHFESISHQTAAEITANNPNHQCDLINPSTNQPCNKQFSRPYDLIRHQETIHASKKKIFRCVICEGRLNGGAGNGKSKTFSRGDALSRHIKVKHGLVGNEAIELINDAKANVEFVTV